VRAASFHCQCVYDGVFVLSSKYGERKRENEEEEKKKKKSALNAFFSSSSSLLSSHIFFPEKTDGLFNNGGQPLA